MTRKEAFRVVARKRIAACRAICRFAEQHGLDPSTRRYQRTNFGGAYTLPTPAGLFPDSRTAGVGFEISAAEREAIGGAT